MIILDALVIGSWIGVKQAANRMQKTALTIDARPAQRLDEDSVEKRPYQRFVGLPSVAAFSPFGTTGDDSRGCILNQ